MDHLDVYTCEPCGAVSPVVVMGLADPKPLIRDKDRTLLRDGGAAVESDLIRSFSEQALRYATCPRCGRRNPKGVAELASSRRMTKLVGTGIAAAIALLIAFVPLAGWLVVAMLAWLVGFRFKHARPIAWKMLAVDVVFLVGSVFAALHTPRINALMPAIIAVRFALKPWDDDAAFVNAHKTLRFDAGYR